MSNAWFRMYAEFAYDPKVQSMPEVMQRRLLMLMCLRCNGDVTLHVTELCFALRINDEELAETKALFLQKKFVDDDWNLRNWDKRQFTSDSSAERVRRHRQKMRNADVTDVKRYSNVLDTDTDTEKKEKESCCAAKEKSAFQKIYDAGSAAFPNLVTANTSAIRAWIAAGCDPELDAVPEIQRHATAGKPVKSWNYFTGGIMDAKATRESPPPKGKPHAVRPNGDSPPARPSFLSEGRRLAEQYRQDAEREEQASLGAGAEPGLHLAETIRENGC